MFGIWSYLGNLSAFGYELMDCCLVCGWLVLPVDVIGKAVRVSSCQWCRAFLLLGCTSSMLWEPMSGRRKGLGCSRSPVLRRVASVDSRRLFRIFVSGVVDIARFEADGPGVRNASIFFFLRRRDAERAHEVGVSVWLSPDTAVASSCGLLLPCIFLAAKGPWTAKV